MTMDHEQMMRRLSLALQEVDGPRAALHEYTSESLPVLLQDALAHLQAATLKIEYYRTMAEVFEGMCSIKDGKLQDLEAAYSAIQKLRLAKADA
jgi:hypothetical protein